MSDQVRKMHQEMQAEFEFLVDDLQLDGALHNFIENIKQEKKEFICWIKWRIFPMFLKNIELFPLFY
ncbi:MAG: hypothetical protein ACJAZX_000763 [Rickettsiales bacterium]|jgi:hypothetical protein